MLLCVCVRAHARALKIVSMDKILRFTNTSVINYYDFFVQCSVDWPGEGAGKNKVAVVDKACSAGCTIAPNSKFRIWIHTSCVFSAGATSLMLPPSLSVFTHVSVWLTCLTLCVWLTCLTLCVCGLPVWRCVCGLPVWRCVCVVYLLDAVCVVYLLDAVCVVYLLGAVCGLLAWHCVCGLLAWRCVWFTCLTLCVWFTCLTLCVVYLLDAVCGLLAWRCVCGLFLAFSLSFCLFSSPNNVRSKVRNLAFMTMLLWLNCNFWVINLTSVRLNPYILRVIVKVAGILKHCHSFKDV